MKRIIWHWTAGAPGINPKESDSYNFVIAWPKGEVVSCVPVARQRPPLLNGAYAAHTRRLNSNSIGVCIDAMAGARERPFRPGKYPITILQLKSLVKITRKLCDQYGIPVSRETTLSHAEVQRTLGVKQAGKWDITWLPHMKEPGDAVEVGDYIRKLVEMEK